MKHIVVGMHSSGKQELFDLLDRQNIRCGKLFSNINLSDIRYDLDKESFIEIKRYEGLESRLNSVLNLYRQHFAKFVEKG